MSPSEPDHVEQDQDGADGDRGVRDVERPEMRRAPVHVDEVDDVAGDRAIDQVAEGAAEDQREPEPRHPLVKAELRRVRGDRHQAIAAMAIITTGL